MAGPVIRVSELTKRFGSILAVDSVSFTVEPGITTALLGGNGAGKTTTLGMLLGLVAPTAGSVNVLGHDMRGRRRYHALARMNFSSPYVDVPHRLTVRQNLTIYGHLYALDDLRGRIAELVRDLDLAAMLDRTVGTLSAGQKTRAALAKALLNEPALLLLDEPTASLDPETAEHVRSYLRNWQRRTNAAILLASHNMTEVERLCDDVIMLRRGRVVDRGSPVDLLARYGRRDMEQVFLDIARGNTGGAADQ